jgi:putative ABC transport system permease protein
MLSFVLAEPQPNITAEALVERIQKETGLHAYTEEQFKWTTIMWFFKNTAVPLSVGLTVIIGFIVGAAISAQTFYSFVLENMRFLGALKAMGTATPLLCRMLLFQSFAVGLIGYGIGMGVVTLFGRYTETKRTIPFMMPWEIPVYVLVIVIVISAFSALLGITKVARLEPAIVFRA